ncbi:MAG: DUF2752 domain-containing protein [Pirellulales bacterium]|nr:DUF2752 domain-containing protein [Pirellulales bacterium]
MESPSIPKHQRLVLTVLGLGLIGLMVVARLLTPSPTECGTHQELGLPPCTFRVLFGLPCPTCGMTTSWAHLVRGEVLAAVHANCGGLLLGVLAMLAVPWSLVSAWRGRWTGWTPRDTVAGWVATGLLVLILLQWAWRLWLR